jgi:hypothetical protein
MHARGWLHSLRAYTRIVWLLGCFFNINPSAPESAGRPSPAVMCPPWAGCPAETKHQPAAHRPPEVAHRPDQDLQLELARRALGHPLRAGSPYPPPPLPTHQALQQRKAWRLVMAGMRLTIWKRAWPYFSRIAASWGLPLTCCCSAAMACAHAVICGRAGGWGVGV